MVGGGAPDKRAKMKGFGTENAITRLSRIRKQKTVRANLYNKALRFFLDGSRKLVTKSSAKSNADFRFSWVQTWRKNKSSQNGILYSGKS